MHDEIHFGWGSFIMLAERLKVGDEIRVIAPSTSMSIVKGEQVKLAKTRLTNLGFNVTFGKHVETYDELYCSSIEDRIEDLHEAFQDPNVKAIMTAIGGYQSNQLLRYLDYDLIKNNPKIFCGYSDITALSLAIYKKCSMITYSGPHFSTFGMKHGLEYTMESFLSAVTNDAPFEVYPSKTWSDDPWYVDQEARTFHEQSSYFVLQEGEATGKLIGGNLCTMNLLQGTEYLPSLKNAILFIEDDEESHPFIFERDLQSLLHLPNAVSIQAVLIGRFQEGSKMTEAALRKIIETKRELIGIPIIANVNIGHADPFATIPIGANATIVAKGTDTEIFIEQL